MSDAVEGAIDEAIAEIAATVSADSDAALARAESVNAALVEAALESERAAHEDARHGETAREIARLSERQIDLDRRLELCQNELLTLAASMARLETVARETTAIETPASSTPEASPHPSADVVDPGEVTPAATSPAVSESPVKKRRLRLL